MKKKKKRWQISILVTCENIEEDEEENISIIEVLSIKKKALPTPCTPVLPPLVSN